MKPSAGDKATFQQGRPYIVGSIALLYTLLNQALSNAEAFDYAELFVDEFERRAGLK